MYFKLICPRCSKALKVREEQAGKRSRCPYCKSTFTVPVPSGIDLGQEPAHGPGEAADLGGIHDRTLSQDRVESQDRVAPQDRAAPQDLVPPHEHSPAEFPGIQVRTSSHASASSAQAPPPSDAPGSTPAPVIASTAFRPASRGAGGRAATSPISTPTLAPTASGTSTANAAGSTAYGSGSSYSSDGSSVSLVTSGVMGFVAAALMFAAALPLKQQDLRLGNLFWNSVSINFPTTLLMCWSFAILALKWRQLAAQRSAMLLDLLPTEVSTEITLGSLDRFVAHIHGLPRDARRSILVNRVLRGIEHFRVRKSAAETVTMMESQSAIDAANVAGSYTIIKVFIWAMPILGFIGTVMGVSSAVSGLSATLQNASDVSSVTESMKSVFAGLGTAFDTTLLALVWSMLVKIPASALQKSEDGLVTIADEYCNENLLRRLNDGREGGAERGAGRNGGDSALFREAVEAAMAAQQAELEQWLSKLDAIGGRLTAQVAQGWTDIHARMQRQQQQQLSELLERMDRHVDEQTRQFGRLQQEHAGQFAATQRHSAELQQQHAEHLAAAQRQFADMLADLQRQLVDMGGAASRLQETLSELAGQSAAAQSEMRSAVRDSAASLETHFSGLERGLRGLSDVLESLGQRQVIVQQVEPERRGWFRRRHKGNGRD